MKEAAIIFPHQLFEDHPILSDGKKVFLIEEWLFFNQYRFHKQKLVFHRASMKCYESYLHDLGCYVEYIEASDVRCDIRKLIGSLDVEAIHVIDPIDNYLSRRLNTASEKCGIQVIAYASPGFINTKEDLSVFFKPTKKKFFQTEFYISQRKKLNILLDQGNNPIGGKWTFDAENRKKYPKEKMPPGINYPTPDGHYKEAISYVADQFQENPGTLSDFQLYPTNFEDAKSWLDQFLQIRFSAFGDYEDAIVANENILNHSVLSPLINSGLLTPAYVVNEILAYADKNTIAINNTEGIVRQIIGWREFIRGVYEVKGTEERTKNFWKFDRKIPDSFYEGTTGIDPIDITIKKLLATGYNHHIERLMVLGNFMVLCEFDPDEVYRWFMEMYIDSYDWVMVPNVYGMSQFADGGLMSTKPYISGSNYLMKMSNYKKGDWQVIWDGLFWRFMDCHRDFFLSNPRLGMLVRTFDKMPPEKKEAHHKVAEDYLKSL
ncbi:cryptochrome/photolyase family protein [Ekhidna sp.]